MSPIPAAYYAASTLRVTPDSSPVPLRSHILLSLLMVEGNLPARRVKSQPMNGARMTIAAGLMALIAVMAVLMARRLHGSHLPPSHSLVTGMAVTLALPFTKFLLDLPGLSVGVFVVGTTVVLAAMRMDEKKRRRRLTTGDFSYRDLW